MLTAEEKETQQENVITFTMEGNHVGELPVFIRRLTPAHTLSPCHRHETVMINYVVKGRLIHVLNGVEVPIVRGDVFIIPPYYSHQLQKADNLPFEVIQLEFLPEFICKEQENISLFDSVYMRPFLVAKDKVSPRISMSGSRQQEIEGLLNCIYQEFTFKPDSFLAAIKAHLMTLLILIDREQRSSGDETGEIALYEHHREAMMRAVRYLDEHFTESISVTEASRIAMLSQSYFSYLFKVMTRRTFVEYLTELRLRKAMELLVSTDRLVVDICFDSGFKNVNHFNRTFKNTVGVSPLQYRKNASLPR